MSCTAFTVLVVHRQIVYFIVSVAKVQYFFEMSKYIQIKSPFMFIGA